MDSNSGSAWRVFTPKFKLKIVLESMRRDTTVEQVRRKYNLNWSVLNHWRKEFRANAPEIFADKRNPGTRAQSQGYAPGQSPDELKRVIGDLTVQVEVLNKAEGLLP